MKYLRSLIHAIIYGDGWIGKASLPVLVIGIILSGSAYITLIAETTFNIADRRQITEEIRVLENELAQLEIHYFEASHRLTLEYALEAGYQLPKNPVFMSTETVVPSIALAP
jgi:hypothetical protein